MLIQRDSANYTLTFLLTSNDDHVSPITGATPTVFLSKAGTPGVAASGAISEVDATHCPGLYKIVGHATDSNTLGLLNIHATAAGADPVDDRHEVVAFNPQSATNLGLGNLDAAVTSRAPANTALSNVTWTDARAGYVDVLNGIAANIASAVWSATTRTLSAFGVDVTLAADQPHYAPAKAGDTMTLAANQHVIADSGTVTSVANPVVVGTNNDKSGYSFDGISLATATEASTAIKDILFDAFRDGSVTLYAHVFNNGNNIQRADISTLAYSIYLLDESDKNARTAVEGHSNVSLVVAEVISDTVQTDGVATGYNFKQTPLVADHPAFTIAGRHYLVE